MNKNTDFDMLLIKGDDDIVLAVKPYCQNCANKKLSVLKKWEIFADEAKNLNKKYNVRMYKIRCEC
jgi:hypothetical protein